LSQFRRLFLLGTITLFLLAGAAWGQSRTPTSPGPNQALPSDKEGVKPSPEGQQELPLKDLREQPVRAQEDQAGKSLKKPHPDKPKSTVSRGKKPGAGKPTSGAQQDPLALKPEPNWWPPGPQAAPPDLSSLEGSLRQAPEKDATPEEDEAEDKSEEKSEKKGEESGNLFQELKKLTKPQVSPEDTEEKED
jgi:hypothetical protein